MFTIGCHLSSAKGYLHMAKDAVSIDANTFQFFTRNPRGGRAKAIDPKAVSYTHLALNPYTCSFRMCAANKNAFEGELAANPTSKTPVVMRLT